MRQLLAATLALVLSAAAASGAPPKVVATIKPIHSLVAAVMGEVATPALLVKGAASPHTYSLRPSDAAALEEADVVFRVGPGFEVFLDDALATLAGDAGVVALGLNPGIALLPLREGGPFEAHEHEGHDHQGDGHGEEEHEGEEHAEEEHEAFDMHVWLDPAFATIMLSQIADTLAAADPEHMEAYFDNAGAERDRIATLAADIAKMLAPVRSKPFIVFHDATHYFEQSFGLAAAGSVTVSPEVLPGAQRIAALRRVVSDTKAACVFAEPNFEPALVSTIIEGTPAKSGTLDPEGALLAEGPELYRELLTGLGQSFAECLRD